jgi:hypothetical protein
MSTEQTENSRYIVFDPYDVLCFKAAEQQPEVDSKLVLQIETQKDNRVLVLDKGSQILSCLASLTRKFNFKLVLLSYHSIEKQELLLKSLILAVAMKEGYCTEESKQDFFTSISKNN